MDAVLSFCGLCLLLVAGKTLRTRFSVFQRLYLPASVIGGLLGLLLLSALRLFPKAEEAEGLQTAVSAWTAGWDAIPAFLINIVFATLFLGTALPGIKRVWQIAAPQVCFGQIMAWGQYAIGLGLTGLILMPLFGVPAAFGNLLEIGFEGGHGTVAGLQPVFEAFDWSIGKDLGFATATIGMLIGIIVGMALVNYAARKGFVDHIRTFDDQSEAEQKGIYPTKREQPLAGRQTVSADSIDSLAFHIAIIGMAVLVGYLFKSGLGALDAFAPESVRKLNVLNSFPLFPLCMLGGLVVQKFIEAFHIEKLVDHNQMQRLSGAALDFLVVAAIASIRIEVVTAFWFPLLILVVSGVAWSVLLVLFVAPRLFKEAWFERAIAEFGQSTGVTATGLLLLRIVDPESRTVATQAFGYKQLIHEPIMGGGIWTSLALPLVFTRGWLEVFLISTVLLIVWSIAAYAGIRKERIKSSHAG